MDNLDIQEAEAERHYYACAYKDCFQITESVLKQDPYHPECLPIHIACLVELEKSNGMLNKFIMYILIFLNFFFRTILFGT